MCVKLYKFSLYHSIPAWNKHLTNKPAWTDATICQMTTMTDDRSVLFQYIQQGGTNDGTNIPTVPIRTTNKPAWTDATICRK